MTPVVVLTGFLGSGKTTLLNRWLALGGGRAPGGGRLALIVNELGAIGIDGALLPGAAVRQVELAGGCVCCQLDDDLAATIAELVARDPALELIVIETTGVADPLPIGWTLARAPLDAAVRLAAVVTVVDAPLHLANRGHGAMVDAQVDGADVLALSKLDVAGGPDAPGVVALLTHLRERNPDALEVVAPPDALARTVWDILRDPVVEVARVTATGAPAFWTPAPHGLRAMALPIEGILDFEELSAALEALPPTIVRIKGIADVVDRSTGDDAPRRVAFHRVGARVSAEPVAGGEPALVAIGTAISREDLAACLRAAVLP
jgi:G3E family GTPase